MTKDDKPQLLRAKASLKDCLPPSGKDATWVTDLSFDEVRSAIVRAFAGIPDQVEGEPIMSWCLNQCNDHKIKEEAISFVLSFPINETFGKKYLDLSIKTADGTIASTALVHEYETKGFVMKRWDTLVGGFRDFFLAMTLWRESGFPELFTSKELKEASKHFESNGNKLVRSMPVWHEAHGPKGLHWYVHFVGTNPDFSKQGYGSQVMKKIGELADQEKADCYLECDSAKNRAFYEKFGFEVVATKVIDDVNPSDSPSVCLMIRRHR